MPVVRVGAKDFPQSNKLLLDFLVHDVASAFMSEKPDIDCSKSFRTRVDGY